MVMPTVTMSATSICCSLPCPHICSFLVNIQTHPDIYCVLQYISGLISILRAFLIPRVRSHMIHYEHLSKHAILVAIHTWQQK